jgi:hypothetical protein
VIAANPALCWIEVKDILKCCCDRIDDNAGEYDADGHSRKYGFGRINARTAVELAQASVGRAATASGVPALSCHTPRELPMQTARRITVVGILVECARTGG